MLAGRGWTWTWWRRRLAAPARTRALSSHRALAVQCMQQQVPPEELATSARFCTKHIAPTHASATNWHASVTLHDHSASRLLGSTQCPVSHALRDCLDAHLRAPCHETGQQQGSSCWQRSLHESRECWGTTKAACTPQHAPHQPAPALACCQLAVGTSGRVGRRQAGAVRCSQAVTQNAWAAAIE